MVYGYYNNFCQVLFEILKKIKKNSKRIMNEFNYYSLVSS